MTSKVETGNPRIVVVGSGAWGKNLIRNYHELGALEAICESDSSRRQSFHEQYPDVKLYGSLDEVLNTDGIDGIVISTPAETHYSLARDALLANKHVYVEKPLALEEKDGVDLVRLAKENNCALMVGHLLQYHPAFTRLKEMVIEGELGRINYMYSHRLNLGKIRREENILWSFAPHDISMILSLAGEEPASVYATGGNYLHQQIADVTTTHLEFPSGVKAHIHVSWLHPYKEQNLVVVGDRKMAVFNDMLDWDKKLCLYAHEIRWEKNVPITVKATAEYVEIPQIEPLRTECEHFLDCLKTGSTPHTDGDEGLRVLGVLKESQRSMDEHGKRVNQEINSKVAEKESAANNRSFFLHPTSFVDEGATIGSDTKIWHFSHVLAGSRIGGRCNIGQNVVIGPDVSIGEGCKIQNNVSVYEGVTLEDHVFCGPSMVFTNVYNPRSEIRKMDEIRPTLVKRGAAIGANATIMCGTTIGRYAFIGAGSVVLNDVPDFALLVGNPARQIGWTCRCGERLSEDLECDGCGETYTATEKGIREN